ncbi:MAG: hypothetical protein ACRD22_16595, partial [Terriglobia bacterium]
LDPTTSYGLSNRSAILTALDTSIYDQTKSAWSAWEDLANMPIPTNVISAFATDDTPHTWGDLWLTAASNDPNLDENSLPPNNGSPTYLLARQAYLYRKYLIPREFNVYPPRFQPDLPSTDNLGRPALYKEGSISPFVPSIYDQRPALNIDTAPLEVLVANFAAVLQEDGPPSSSDLGGVDPLILADRIASCRPFFSRVDWEDFLAANLDDADFANIYGNLPARMIDTTTDIAIADSGGPKGNFVPASTDPGYATIVSQNVLTGIPGINIVGTQARMQWFRNQIVATGSPRLTARGFNALLSASWKSPSLSYYAKTANLTYDEDTHNPGHPLYLNVSWKQGGADYPLPSPPLNPTGSIQVPMVQLGSWKPGIQTGVYEWNLAGNGAAAGAAWDSSGTSNYMVPTGGDIPDAWGSINKTEPVIIAMPIKLRSYLFEVFTRGRYIQIVNQVPTVRAVQKLHAVYDSVNKVVWMRRELGSDKGALSDP